MQLSANVLGSFPSATTTTKNKLSPKVKILILTYQTCGIQALPSLLASSQTCLSLHHRAQTRALPSAPQTHQACSCLLNLLVPPPANYRSSGSQSSYQSTTSPTTVIADGLSYLRICNDLIYWFIFTGTSVFSQHNKSFTALSLVLPKLASTKQEFHQRC